ncbi:proline dehydrogenase family protein [Gordonia sp. HS-NH1]|uniref:proline dehydrogenase family protein n=1 Tax=Gordonia sp. HS-NH1 TaxID=1435068 RepID=UPI0006E131C9|nr:proline dehydrogenase family protein [Gordonia sp. HS-NH1]
METTSAADTLRRWALDEELKSRVMADPALAEGARRIAERYTAGEDVDSAIRAGERAVERGHLVSIEYTGESVRDAAEATAATEVFVSVAERIGRTGLPSTVSGDLSHIGLLVSGDLVRDNAARLAEACAAVDSVFMISAEGSDRTDRVLEVYDWLSHRYDNVGITLQARLHRSDEDVDRLLAAGGRVRLVKGAYLEAESEALPREDPELPKRFERLARRIVDGGGSLTLATHDDALLTHVLGSVDAAESVEVEMLMGLGTDLLDRLATDGIATREYCIFGSEWWLYVLNRIAEDPTRVFQALVDLGRGPISPPASAR